MTKQEKSYELIKFIDGTFSLDVKVEPNEDTVWLNAQEIGLLFDRDEKTIRKHISTILTKELDNSTVAKFATAEEYILKGHVVNAEMLLKKQYKRRCLYE